MTRPRLKRLFRFSLRTVFVATTVLCIWLGMIVTRGERQKKAVAWVKEMGGNLTYDYEIDVGPRAVPSMGVELPKGEPPGPKWLRELIGVDHFATVKSATLPNTTITDLSPLASLIGLKLLHLECTEVHDLLPLTGLTDLETLILYHVRVSDHSSLPNLPNLKVLSVSGTSITSLRLVKNLTSLETLVVRDVRVSDLSPLASLANLEELWVVGTQVNDLSPLVNMTSLKALALSNVPIKDLSTLANLTKLTWRSCGEHRSH